MQKAERASMIQQLIGHKSFVSISDIVHATGTSRATVYRDLKNMEKDGSVLITRGGVTSIQWIQAIANDEPYEAKIQSYADEKKRIAAEACMMIEPNMSVFLDSSTTVYAMCEHIINMDNIKVFTNDIYIANYFKNELNISVFVIGGILRTGYHTLVDMFGCNNYYGLTMDVAFFGCDAISLQRGVMITNSEEILLKRQMMSASQRSVVLCDHAKFQKSAYLSFARLENIDKVISNAGLDSSIYKEFLDAGVYIDLV